MTGRIIVFLFFLIPIMGVSQTYQFTKTAGGIDTDGIYDGCLDVNGNAFFIGLFQNTVDFKKDFGGGDVRSLNNSSNIFITKLNTDKTYGWTKTINEFEFDALLESDLQGNTYAAFTFQAGLDLGTDFILNNPPYTNGYTDICILKIKPDGSSGGIKRIGGEYFEYINDFCRDRFGNFYLVGEYTRFW